MNPRASTLLRWVMHATERARGELPTFPAVATQLVDLLEKPEADLREVERLIARDQAIASEVLRVANSSMFGAAMPAQTVHQSVLRLGFRETGQVAMIAAYRVLFDVEARAELEVFPQLWRRLWHDALVCAYGARLLAQDLKQGLPERVFLAAMFRNVGCLLVLKAVARGCVRGTLRLAPSEAELGLVMGALHARLGASYLRSCAMPEAWSGVAEHHHSTDVPFSAETLELHLVRISDGLCGAIGVTPFAPHELGPLALESADAFGLGPDRLELFTLQFRELAEQVRGLG